MGIGIEAVITQSHLTLVWDMGDNPDDELQKDDAKNLCPDCDIIFKMGKAGDIPRELFWDTDPARLDIQKNRQFIIERTLELGDERAVNWLFSTYPRKEIKRILAESRRISLKSYQYWSLILKE
jgi:hypothetical protein